MQNEKRISLLLSAALLLGFFLPAGAAETSSEENTIIDVHASAFEADGSDKTIARFKSYMNNQNADFKFTVDADDASPH